jgi:MSHA biogenesis protein MshN
MSLLNQVLRDLDARKAGDKARAGLPSAVTPLSARMAAKPTAYRWWLAGLAALGASALLVIQPWQTTPAPQARLAATPPTPQPATGAAIDTKKVGAGETARFAESPTSEASDKASAALGNAGAITPQAQHPSTQSHAASPAPHPETILHGTGAAVDGSGDNLTDGRGDGRSHVPAETQRTKPLVATTPNAPLPASASSGEDATGTAKIVKQLHQATAAERAEAAYRQGLALQQQGRLDDALESYRNALVAQADHLAARQSLVALLIQIRRYDEAEDALVQGMAFPASALPSLLSLGRLRVDRNDSAGALQLLLEHADIGTRSAEYEGFLATLLNRTGHYDEAAEHYRRATQLAPREAKWWVGLGIALDAQGQTAPAKEAYARARELPGLPEELAKHVEQRLNQ